MPGAACTPLAETRCRGHGVHHRFSRLYLCVHNPTDVLFGTVLGIACGVAAVAIVRKIAEALQKRKAQA
mgnify:CR=1 FL=1